MMPLNDLDQSLAALDPRAVGDYLFCTVGDVPEGLEPFATVREDEGTTVVVTKDEARAHGLSDGMLLSRISLGAFTSLEAVGITATIAQTLASSSIPCNVIAGYYHDHLFVPQDRAKEALRLLRGLVKQAEGWLPANTPTQ